MLSSLKNHPFAVEAFFDSSLVLTFAVPMEQLQPMVPECVQLDTYKAAWAFIAIALVQTRDLRPKGFPRFTGNSFFLAGYRIFVRYTTNAGKNLRGLYILKSETDKKKMTLLGNIFTHYRYTTTDIKRHYRQDALDITSTRSHFSLRIDTSEQPVPLPDVSPFATWKEARRYAGPLPFTFSYNAGKKEVLIIEGVRQHWIPKPVRVLDYHFSFLDTLNLEGVCLANAFIIHNIPYYWKKGRTEIWQH